MVPLDGLVVLDLTRLLPGPYCSWLLRSWGARTVKVEDSLVGDYLRDLQPTWFGALNAGAESLAVDLKTPAGRSLVLRLAKKADVLLEGFRPGVMQRLGLGYDSLRAVNPRLVMVSLTGYGPTGEMANRAGHDINYLAQSGLLSLMNELPPVQLADLTGGMFAAAGALAAVIAARQTGQGTHVQGSLLGSVSALGLLQAAEAADGRPPEREHMTLAGSLPCYRVYGTADGREVALGALEPKFWRAFCEAVDRPDWVSWAMEVTLCPAVARLFQERSLAEWLRMAQVGDFCLEPVRTIVEALDEFLPPPVQFGAAHPGVEGSENQVKVLGPAPRLGEQTSQILRQAGLSEQEIATLAAEAVIVS